jgi:hypothetical protein
MYFHTVHGKNIELSADKSEAKRTFGFCQGITFSNSPLTQLQRVTFQVSQNTTTTTSSQDNNSQQQQQQQQQNNWNGHLKIGLTTKNPSTLTSSDLPEFSYPTLLNTDGFWITTIKPSYLKHGNKLTLVLDEKNSLQLSINYIVKATLFSNDSSIAVGSSTKLWLILDICGANNAVKFLPSDDTPYEIKARGLGAVDNFHSACLFGAKSMYKTRLLIVGQEGVGKTSLRNCLVDGSK